MDSDGRTVLLVEDTEDDVFFMKDTMKRAGLLNPLQVVGDGRKAIDYLNGNGGYSDRKRFPFPCLVLLDLKLPEYSGFEVLDSRASRHEAFASGGPLRIGNRSGP